MTDIAKSQATWSALVHNKDITSNEVLDAYKDWANSYEPDLLAIHPDRAQHMAVYLKELCEKSKINIYTAKVLDVAAGTGLVGMELVKVGFQKQNIIALDYSQEMLDLAEKKDSYGGFICAPFGNTIPDNISARSFDCVIMLGGFAAGHLPLSSLHTMARICKKGGLVLNSMTLQYSEFVDEYLFINEYIQELEEDRVWMIEFKKVLDNYIRGKQGLVHAMKVL